MKALLDKLQAVTPNFNQEDCNKAFQEIAEILLNDYAIQIHDRIYRMTDVEFYFYDSNIDDARISQENRKVTYERTTPAGCWFFHDSGIDITFSSDKAKGYGGGILIRGIKKIYPKEQESIYGPKKCYWELFDDYVSAFESMAPNPYLIPYCFSSRPEIHTCLRVGLSQKEKNPRKWRFYIKLQ